MENKEVDFNEVCFTIEVDKDVLDSVRKEQRIRTMLPINDENYHLMLENIDGLLVLCTEKMPTTYHGCYYYNRGTFPYVIKKTLQFIVLANGDDSCLTRIVKTEIEAGTRFRFKENGHPSVEDPHGDSCIWNVIFELELVREEDIEKAEKANSYMARKTYLLRWNPAISSFKLETYREATTQYPDGFGLNWSIYEWQEAKEGDIYYMVRVGDDKAGIVFRGEFRSGPYSGEDWAGKGKPRKYVDITCECCAAPDGKPWLSVEELSAAIPEINWGKGHSGELLPMDVAAKLEDLWNESIHQGRAIPHPKSITSQRHVESPKLNRNINGTDISFPQDRLISFEESTHTYKVNGIGEMTPVSRVVEMFFTPFDAEKVSLRKCMGNEVEAAKMREQWECRGAFASQAGTFMHKQIENFLNDRKEPQRMVCEVIYDGQYLHKKEHVDISREWSYFKAFDKATDYHPFRTEWCVYDTDARIAGTIDLICSRSDGTYELYDWKRSNKVNPTEINPWSSGINGLEHLSDTSYIHYCLQQNLYRYMLEKNYGITISRMNLVVLHPDSMGYRIVPVPIMKKEVKTIVDFIKK